MIGEFTQLNAFTEAVVQLKENGCYAVNYRDSETAVKSIWLEFTDALFKRLNEQDTPDKLSVYVKVTQNNLTDFADKIFDLHEDSTSCDDSCHEEIRSLLFEIGIEVTRILEQLYINFTDHFDKFRSFPQWGVFDNKKLLPQVKRIIHGLEEKRIDVELIHIVASVLGSIHTGDEIKIKNWRQFFYLKALVNVLSNFVTSPASDDPTLKLIKLLIGYNFNPLIFYEYMLDFISSVINRDMPYEEQEMELLSLLRMIENIRLECKAGYDTDVVPIIESVRNFIQRELDILGKMKEVIMPYSQNGGNGRTSNYYFEVSTTLEELFFLVRVMLEVRFIRTKFKSNLYSFVAKHIRTDRSKTPSTQYMRNIFGPNREVPLRIIRKVRGWLMTMVAYIDANFGNQMKLWLIGILSHSLLIEFSLF